MAKESVVAIFSDCCSRPIDRLYVVDQWKSTNDDMDEFGFSSLVLQNFFSFRSASIE